MADTEIIEDKGKTLHWVGIGASAGGLEAIREFVASIPDDPTHDITYIIAQHLSPKHRSMLVQLVGRETSLEVRELEDATEPQPNVIYITPPNQDVFVEDGTLYLREPVAEFGPKPSVDLLFTSLAEHVGDQAVGVILSGTGSDGAHGVRAIRAAGGIVVAQDPENAKYDGMPKYAIETGCVDLVMLPNEMMKEISKVIQSPRDLQLLKDNESQRTSIQELLHVLKQQSGVDFKNYKTGTLYRRINRRMVACNTKDLDQYVTYIGDNPEEVDLLYKDILISVTSFFRDTEAFEALKSELANVLEKKEQGDQIRVWLPGCATGEEAYSIAILFAELAGGIGPLTQKYNFQIFATDIDVDALGRARRGAYSQTILENVDKTLKERYFRQRENQFEVVKPLRDVIVFSKHNVFDDPPFLRLDVIACRNLLIYFNSNLQHSVLSLFHYALNGNGRLFLGKSEALGQSASLFHGLDSTNKIYSRKMVTSGEYPKSERSVYKVPIKRAELSRVTSGNKVMHDLPDAVIDALSPDSILIDEDMEIVRIYGDVHAYTQLSPGQASMNLMSMARKEFRQELRALVYKILREDASQTMLSKKLDVQGKLHEVNIIIRPLRMKNVNQRLLLVSFEKARAIEANTDKSDDNDNADPFVVELEQELTATKEHLQTVVEELETSNEELQSTNEEMQSTNEELQSSNEELETANEELQSTNEELLTVNEELQVKTAELTGINEDLNNIKENMGISMLVVDKDLRIRRYNSAASSVFLLNEDSNGVAINNVASVITVPDLPKNILAVIKSGKPFERQLDEEGVCYLERIWPFKDENGAIHGAVLTYLDNTSERNAVRQLRESEERFGLAVSGSNVGIWDWNITSREMYLSKYLKSMVGLTTKREIFKFNDFEKRIHPDDYDDVMSILDAHLKRGFDFNVEFRMEKSGDKNEYIWVKMRGHAIWDENKKPYRMAGSIFDTTDRRNALEQLTQTNHSLERFAYVCSHDLKEPARIVENFTDLFLTKYADQIDDVGREYLNHVIDSSRTMQQMIKDILSYSQLENKSTAFVNVDCDEEIQKVIKNLDLTLKETDADIIYKGLPVIKADRIQIYQIFQNLIGNAIKFCDKDKPKVIISAEDKGEEWQFVVKDNGVGIKPEYSNKIFGVFQRLNHKEDYPGTGIGLSICQKIVQKHGGRIWVESTPGQGASFYFTLPKHTAGKGPRVENKETTPAG